MNRISALRKRAKQKGVTVLQILVGTVLGALIAVAATQAILGQQYDAQFNEARGFFTVELANALSSYYYSNNRSYVGLTADTAAFSAGTGAHTNSNGSLALIQRYRLREELPWGDDYWRVSTAGTKTAVVLQVSCRNLSKNATDNAARCAQLREAINAAAAPLLGTSGCAAPTGTPLAFACTYGTPT